VIGIDQFQMTEKDAPQEAGAAFWPLIEPIKTGLSNVILKSTGFDR
jgi:hypothetical protein